MQRWEPIRYHEPHGLCIIAGGSQKQLILSKNSTFIYNYEAEWLSWLSKYLLFMEIRFNAMLYS